MKFVYSDGGRSKYFKAQNVRDCVPRAICNATGMDYKEVYDALSKLQGKSVRNGTLKKVDKKYIESLGWRWIPTMKIGSGCITHLNEYDLPNNKTLIVAVSKHLTCVKNGVIYDTYDCSRGGNRCVYGYWEKIMEETNKCCICGKEFDGFGNNAEPLAHGLCCDECNNTKVLPARLVQYYKSKKEVK